MPVMNKIKLLCCLFLFLGLSSLSAQITVGLQVQSGESWQYYGEETAINGFDQQIPHYGVSAQVYYPVLPHLAVGLSPGFMRRGAACFPGFTGGFQPVQDATIYANYLQLPVMLKADFPLGGRWFTYAEGGAGFSYLLNGHWDLLFANLEGDRQRRDIDFEEDSFLNRFDFAVQANLGVAYQLGVGQLRLGAGYYHGLLDVNDNNTSENRAWSINLAYHYSLGNN